MLFFSYRALIKKKKKTTTTKQFGSFIICIKTIKKKIKFILTPGTKRRMLSMQKILSETSREESTSPPHPAPTDKAGWAFP